MAGSEFAALSPVAQGTLAAVGTWLVTALGALPVLWFRSSVQAG